MRSETKVITGDKLGAAICEAMGIDPSKVQRVIVDAEVGQPAKVYFQMVGDERLLKTDWSILADMMSGEDA
jgi:hypothetical protein